jgi:hypothetical protein
MRLVEAAKETHQERIGTPTAERLSRDCEAAAQRLVAGVLRAGSLSDLDATFGAFWGDTAVRAVLDGSLRQVERVRIGKIVRDAFAPLREVSSLWWHCRERPYGYPGDFDVLEYVYDLSPYSTSGPTSSSSSSGALLDLWSWNLTLPRAVRARKNVLRMLLQERLSAREGNSAAGSLRVLSFASGAARELRELRSKSRGLLDVTLVDQDRRALDYARGALLGNAWAPQVTVVEGDVVRTDATAAGIDGCFEVVYSFGLFDYLPDRLLLESARPFVAKVAPGGEFVFCLKDARYYDATVYDWFWDWRFVPRVREDGFRLARELGLEVAQTFVVEAGAVAVYVCRASCETRADA